VWSANGGMKAIIDALDVVYEERENRGFLKLNAISLAFTFGGLVAALPGGGVALPIILTTIGLGSISDFVTDRPLACFDPDVAARPCTLSVRAEPPRAAVALA
jgi:uncharacterized BrkB/YihY/UPF0761 family membrane protein